MLLTTLFVTPLALPAYVAWVMFTRYAFCWALSFFRGGGFPITYSVDGKQYVAVATGNFLISGAFLALTPELTGAAQGNNLYVFALE